MTNGRSGFPSKRVSIKGASSHPTFTLSSLAVVIHKALISLGEGTGERQEENLGEGTGEISDLRTSRSNVTMTYVVC